MPTDLTVHLNREFQYSIEATPSPFEFSDTFDIILQNHGQAVRVFLKFDAPFEDRVQIKTPNRYVDTKDQERVSVRVGTVEPGDGSLEVSIGYGSETTMIPVSVVERERDTPQVAVDKSLGDPTPPPERSFINENRTVIAFGVIALVSMTGIVVLVRDTTVLVGGLIVILGLVLAGVFLLTN